MIGVGGQFALPALGSGRIQVDGWQTSLPQTSRYFKPILEIGQISTPSDYWLVGCYQEIDQVGEVWRDKQRIKISASMLQHKLDTRQATVIRDGSPIKGTIPDVPPHQDYQRVEVFGAVRYSNGQEKVWFRTPGWTIVDKIYFGIMIGLVVALLAAALAIAILDSAADSFGIGILAFVPLVAAVICWRTTDQWADHIDIAIDKFEQKFPNFGWR